MISFSSFRTRRRPQSSHFHSSSSIPAIVVLAAIALSSSIQNQAVVRAQTGDTGEFNSSGGAAFICADERIVHTGCDNSTCNERCNLFGSTYLLKKCCKHAGINAIFLAFEESETWIPRINEYNKCTGANVRIQYHAEGEDGMADALIEDVGINEVDTSGQGIFDAYIVQAPWLPPVYEGLQSLSEFIKANDADINFQDINQASRSAVSFGGEVRALPLDADYIAMGWRQDVFDNPDIKMAYYATWGEELSVPDTIEEIVIVSERLNGHHDYNNDGVDDWGFCLTPQTNYFQAFLAPVLQTHMKECKFNVGGYECLGADTGQNIFFDVENFDPLIFNEGYRYAVELYSRFIMSSNCQVETAAGKKCDRKTAFPTGRCAGVISMPGTLTKLLQEGGDYAPPPELRMDSVLPEGAYWGRRKVFPGSRKVVDWSSPDLSLVDCTGKLCPHARGGINYAPYFSEGGESYALNGRQSKPAATEAMWDMFVWLSTLPVGDVPLAGIYRKSQVTPEAIDELSGYWNNTVMAQDLNDVLQEYFKREDEGGNPVQDLFVIGGPDYNDVLDMELHENFILASIENGGLFNMDDPSKSIHPVDDKEEFDSRYSKFIANLTAGLDVVNSQMNGGALQQLILWRSALDISPQLSKEEICEKLLVSGDNEGFNKLGCITVVALNDLCQSQKEDVEAYAPGTCKEAGKSAIIAIIVICTLVGIAIFFGLVYYSYKRYITYQRIRKSHEQLMEATLYESIRSLHQLDYPLHLVRGDEFVKEGKLMRHEVLRNTHKLTVLDSLSDVDAFIAVGKHVVFFSHQWTSFKNPDPSGDQYDVMCASMRVLTRRNGWDESLKDVFVWVDYSCIPQANSSTQNLAIRSLAAYASSATYFIIIAPETSHADLENTCDINTYQKRMWCRAEQVCHSMRNGTDGMYLATSNASLEPVKNNFFIESLHVFDGELTCCRLEHKGMGACDRQSLVIPLLGLYGELARASHEAKTKGAENLVSVDTFLMEIEKHQEDVFPRTFIRVMWRKNMRVSEEVMLFGDLIDRMKAKISSGAAFEIEDENTGTLSTKGSDFIRHGGSDFIRHGVIHGSGKSNTVHGVRIETAVGSLAS